MMFRQGVIFLGILTIEVLGWLPHDCGRCHIKSKPGERCEVTGIPEYSLKPIPRSIACYSSKVRDLRIDVVPTNECRQLTLKVSFQLPEEGVSCLEGFRLSINFRSRKSQGFIYAYDIRLENTSVATLDKDARISFDIPNRAMSTCARELVTMNTYYLMVQTVPGPPVYVKSVPDIHHRSDIATIPEWDLAKWTTTIHYDFVPDGIEFSFDLPTDLQCECLKKFKVLLKREGKVGFEKSIVVYYPDHGDIFYNVPEGNYSIILYPMGDYKECGDNRRCKRSYTPVFNYKNVRPPPTTQDVFKPDDNLSDGAEWGIAAAVSLFSLILIGLAYVVLHRLVIILHSGEGVSADVRRQNSRLRKFLISRKYFSLVIYIKNLNRVTFIMSKFLVNFSRVIIILTSPPVTDRDFFEDDRTWANDSKRRRMLSLVNSDRNRKKRLLVELVTGVATRRTTGHCVDWVKLPGHSPSKDLSGDADGREFLNHIKDLSEGSKVEGNGAPENTELINRGSLDSFGGENETDIDVQSSETGPL